MSTRLRSLIATGIFALLCVAGIVPAARADNVAITYSPATQTTPNFGAICAATTICDYGTENFTAWNGTSGTFVSSFNDAGAGTYYTPAGVTFTGTYSAGTGTTYGSGGEWTKLSQDHYGGVNGLGYPELYGPTAPQVTNKAGTASTATYNLALSATGVPGVNYFGIWISALDPNNNLVIYNGSTIIAQFNSQILLTQLGTCTGTNPYCGNPASQFLGQDAGELFVYVNVFDLNGYITNVSFTNSGSTGFESDNHAVAYVNPVHPVGQYVPEPASLAVFSVGAAALFRARRRRR